MDSYHVCLCGLNTIAGIFIKIDPHQFYYSYQYDLATQTPLSDLTIQTTSYASLMSFILAQ